MIDAIKKAMLAGVGAAVLTAEKVEEALSEWVEKGKLSADEAKAMAARIAEQGKVEFEKTSRDVQQAVKELLEKAGVGQKDRIDALEKRLLALEIEVANLSTHARTHPPQ
jgi:polyhydroxyalkanoate synthesis regulator phasin